MIDITIKTDGSCVDNDLKDENAIAKPGCAFVVYDDKTNMVIAKKAFRPVSDKPFTESRCEAMAILAAIEWLIEHKEYRATIESDSKIIVDGIVGLARRRANRDLWKQLESQIPRVADRIRKFSLIPRWENRDADHIARVAALAIHVGEDFEGIVPGGEESEEA